MAVLLHALAAEATAGYTSHSSPTGVTCRLHRYLDSRCSPSPCAPAAKHEGFVEAAVRCFVLTAADWPCPPRDLAPDTKEWPRPCKSSRRVAHRFPGSLAPETVGLGKPSSWLWAWAWDSSSSAVHRRTGGGIALLNLRTIGHGARPVGTPATSWRALSDPDAQLTTPATVALAEHSKATGAM